MTTSSVPAVEYERDTTLLSVIRSLIKRTSRTDNRQIALLIYLVDWRAALVSGSQVTTIRWRLDLRGPKTRTIEEIIRQIRSEKGGVGTFIKGMGRRTSPELDMPALAALEHVITTTAKMPNQELNRNVLATWPVLQSNAESAREISDLAQAAAEYRSAKGVSF